MARITLEIVGIYFSSTQNIAIDPANPPTVAEVMNEFIDIVGTSNQVGGFDYMTSPSSNPMFMIQHNYPGGVTRSGNRRVAGLYSLQETSSEDGKIAYAWQYYIVDATGARVSRTNPGEGFSSFQQARFAFDDDWRIIWRLVGIVRRP
ncbi:MAG: hypothetical protein N838_03085 [Thiohalocapsa sp. PB-PSB1]|jgi:hypothetical protein|nr:MAG: hypothetical protein N838_03085 [Thiohalocapsa sp. PB-PSB1]